MKRAIFIMIPVAMAGVSANAVEFRRAANRDLVPVEQARMIQVSGGTTTGTAPVNTTVPTTTTTSATTTTTAQATTTAPAAVQEDNGVSDILTRYSSARQSAMDSCSGISDKLSSIKTMAGISTGASAIGTLGGGAAAVSGFMKNANDKKDSYAGKFEVLADPAQTSDEAFNEAIKSPEFVSEWKDYKELMKKYADEKPKNADLQASAPGITGTETPEKIERKDVANAAEMLNANKDVNKKSQTLGTIRTVGSFVAGGTGAVSAVTVFIGLKQFDDLISEMDGCTAAVGNIDRLKSELQFASPDDPNIAGMKNIVDSCKGMDSKNIASIKSKLSASGIISLVSTATGVAGGVTSMMANKKPENLPDLTVPNDQQQPTDENLKDGKAKEVDTSQSQAEKAKKLGNVSNILAVATTVSSLASAILSGTTLSGLNKNADIASSCKDAF